MITCSSFLLSVLGESIGLSLGSKKSLAFQQLSNNHLSSPERTSILKDGFYFVSDPSCCPSVKDTVPDHGTWDFLRATWLSPSCRGMEVKIGLYYFSF